MRKEVICMLCPNCSNQLPERDLTCPCCGTETVIIPRKDAERDHHRKNELRISKTAVHAVIEEGTEKLCCHLLCRNKNIKSVTLPDSVARIEWSAFDECTALSRINIPDSVTHIGDNAFIDCTSLAEISLPDSVTYIGDGAFNGCTSLAEIAVPDSVTEIYDWTFNECVSLEKVTLPPSVTAVGSYAFYHCTSLKEITIPDSLTRIGSGAFEKCRLEKVFLSETAYQALSDKYDLNEIFGDAQIVK